jgi:hypothetical protein
MYQFQRSFFCTCIFSVLAFTQSEAVISLAIDEVAYLDNGTTVIQTAGTTTTDNASTPADLIYVDITLSGGGTLRLDEFNTGVVNAVALNFSQGTPGFEVFYNNQTINTDDISAFSAGIEAVYSNTNLRDYVNKDSSANANNPTGDYDISYQYALSNDDYIVVAERDGNSAISLQALDASGNVIGSQLDFVAADYTWDTGYRSSQDTSSSSQTLELGVVDISEFATTADIFGIRVINDSGADNKIFIASDDTFTNNVLNPTVPEPSSYALLFGGFTIVFVMLKRTRSAK